VGNSAKWPRAEVIETLRLTLEPLRVEHADELAPVLYDRSLHEYIGGHPETREQLRAQYVRRAAGESTDRAHGWLNWVIRDRETQAAVGTVQATLDLVEGRTAAAIAWIVASTHQRQGYAKEAASAMVRWLRDRGVEVLIAHIHPEHNASISVARHLGLKATDVVVEGETRWIG
jgi:RimJ/RimL family protein N-acetyltransferase